MFYRELFNLGLDEKRVGHVMRTVGTVFLLPNVELTNKGGFGEAETDQSLQCPIEMELDYKRIKLKPRMSV